MVKEVIIIFNIENVDVKVVNKNSVKKKVWNIILNGSCLKIEGNIMNKRFGFFVGFIFIEKIVGKMVSFVSKEIKIFNVEIEIVDFGKFCCLDRYELYVIIIEMFILREKNVCFIVNKMVWDVSFEKSGYKKKDIFFIVFFNVKEWIMIIINKIKRVGIKILFVFLILFWMFFVIIIIVKRRKINWEIIVCVGLVMVELNKFL